MKNPLPTSSIIAIIAVFVLILIGVGYKMTARSGTITLPPAAPGKSKFGGSKLGAKFKGDGGGSASAPATAPASAPASN